MKPLKKRPSKVSSLDRWLTTYLDHIRTTKIIKAHNEVGSNLRINKTGTISHLEGERRIRTGTRTQETNLAATQRRPLHPMQTYQSPWTSITPVLLIKEGPPHKDEPPRTLHDRQLTIQFASSADRWDILPEIALNVKSSPKDVSRSGPNRFPFQTNSQLMTHRQQPPWKTE